MSFELDYKDFHVRFEVKQAFIFALLNILVHILWSYDNSAHVIRALHLVL